MTAAALAAPGLLRDRALDRPSWWRCLVQGLGFGTVTGLIELGTVVTTYHVQLDTGDRHAAWPASVEPVPGAAGQPVLVCLRGGRP